MLGPTTAALFVVSIAIIVALLARGTDAQKLKWKFPTGGAVQSSPILDANGTLYVGSRDGNVYAIYTTGSAAGTLKWTFPTGGTVQYSPILDANGTLYVGSLDVNTGLQRIYEIYTMGSAVHGSVSSFIFSTGFVAPWFSSLGMGFSSPILDENGTLYVAGAKGFGLADVYAIYATGNAAGSQKWTLRLFSDCSLIMSPTLLYTNATLYVGTSYMCGSTQKGDVYAIYTTGSAAGTLKWKFPFGSPVQSPPIFVGRGVQSSPILDANGTLYVGSNDGNVYAIYTTGSAAGTLKWKFPTGSAVRSSPILDANGTLYVGSDDGNVYAIYTTGSAAGTLKWTFPTGSPVQSSPILDANGTLYVGSNDGNVYAMYTGMNCSCSAGAHLSSAPFTDCSSLSTSCPPCGIGFYCPYIRAYGFTLQVPCPLGTFCNSRALSAAPLCPSGTYNNVPQSGACFLCPLGTFCPTQTNNSINVAFPGLSLRSVAPIPCSIGGYCPFNGMSAPVPCPPGSYCPSISMTSPIVCPAGTYCPSTSSTVPVSCPVGSYCPTSNMSSPILCPAGTFNNVSNAMSSIACVTCPRGSFCIGQQIVPIPCSSLPYGSLCNYVAPCPSAICGKQPCGYTNGNSVCTFGTSCLTNGYCPSFGSMHPSVCPSGSYCPFNGMSAPVPCPPGSYCPSISMTSPIVCPPANFCPNANMVNPDSCYPGVYCPSSGMSAAINCPSGSFCLSGATSPSPCPAGTFQPAQAAASAAACLACNAGSYCPQGTPRSISCPAGTSTSSFNLTQESQCSECPAGYFAPSGASACSKCGEDQTSSPASSSCTQIVCIPSAFSRKQFDCYSDTAKILVVIGYVATVISSIITAYKLLQLAKGRAAALRAAGIRPTVKGILFLQHTLASHSQRVGNAGVQL